jgi:hypothetical protein
MEQPPSYEESDPSRPDANGTKLFPNNEHKAKLQVGEQKERLSMRAVEHKYKETTMEHTA